MARIMIEGSNTPCAFLARGERAEVQDSDHVQRLIKRGFVNVIDTESGEPEPTPLPEAPSRNANKTEWQNFLTAQGVEFDPDATHAELLAAWDKFNEGTTEPTES